MMVKIVPCAIVEVDNSPQSRCMMVLQTADVAAHCLSLVGIQYNALQLALEKEYLVS